ncbi:ATP-binding cassette domain-containing protein [Acholeplasma palmae]
MLLTSITLLSINLNDIGIKAGLFSQHLKYTQDYYKYIDSKEITYEKGNELPLLNDIEINLVDVSFKYPNSDKYILKNINLKIDSNSKIAIVGENGAGKTTLIKLICGLLRPTEGKIFVNNIDSALFSQKAYYKMFGMVFQDTAIFAGSILENVMGTKKENIEFAKLAINKSGLEEKVNSLELKYDQPLLKVIHSNGIDLSGGQIQKLNIARAIYKDAPIVILDEPTASLDALAEEQIYSDFNEVAKNKTSIFISHRLSSTKFCDKIILLTKEGIKESGTHDELIKEKGLYYKMFEVQGKYYQEVEA